MNQYARTTIEWNRQVKIEESKIKKGIEATTKRKSLMKYSEQMNRKKKPSQSRAVKISFTAPQDTRQIQMKWEFESSVYKTNRKEEEAESHP